MFYLIKNYRLMNWLLGWFLSEIILTFINGEVPVLAYFLWQYLPFIFLALFLVMGDKILLGDKVTSNTFIVKRFINFLLFYKTKSLQDIPNCELFQFYIASILVLMLIVGHNLILYS